MKRRSGEEVKHPILKCTPSVVILVSHVNAHQRAISAKKNLKNFVCKMTISLESVSLFPQPLLFLAQWANEKVAVAARMVVIHELSNMDFYSPYLATATAECSLCQNVEQL